jgi:hypothetical protein
MAADDSATTVRRRVREGSGSVRSILVHLREATEAEVATFLARQYPAQPGPPWILERSGDPVLCIDFYGDLNQEFEVEDYFRLLEHLGGDPSVSVIADVSGRHPGDTEVVQFVRTLLQEFAGVAQDEYTSHCWTLEEVLAGHQVQAHPFFDYLGWYNDQREP